MRAAGFILTITACMAAGGCGNREQVQPILKNKDSAILGGKTGSFPKKDSQQETLRTAEREKQIRKLEVREKKMSESLTKWPGEKGELAVIPLPFGTEKYRKALISPNGGGWQLVGTTGLISSIDFWIWLQPSQSANSPGAKALRRKCPFPQIVHCWPLRAIPIK